MKKVQQHRTDDQLLTLWIASTMEKLPNVFHFFNQRAYIMPKLNQSPFFALKTLTHTPRYVTQTNHSFFSHLACLPIASLSITAEKQICPPLLAFCETTFHKSYGYFSELSY